MGMSIWKRIPKPLEFLHSASHFLTFFSKRSTDAVPTGRQLERSIGFWKVHTHVVFVSSNRASWKRFMNVQQVLLPHIWSHAEKLLSSFVQSIEYQKQTPLWTTNGSILNASIFPVTFSWSLALSADSHSTGMTGPIGIWEPSTQEDAASGWGADTRCQAEMCHSTLVSVWLMFSCSHKDVKGRVVWKHLLLSAL